MDLRRLSDQGTVRPFGQQRSDQTLGEETVILLNGALDTPS